MALDEGVLSMEYTDEYQILYETVKKTNSSKVLRKLDKSLGNFEPTEKVENKAQTDAFLQARPILLPEPRYQIIECIKGLLEAVQAIGACGDLDLYRLKPVV